MITSFLITFRETFEAALVIGIMLAYLVKTRNFRYNRFVYWGAFGGVLISVITAFAFSLIAGGFEGRNEQIFEGTTMLIAAFLVTTMIIWMASRRHMGEEIEKRVQKNIDKKYGFGIALFSFFSVYREGVEIILFLSATSFAAMTSFSDSIAVGAYMGILGAMLLGYLFFKAALRFNLKLFFLITGGMLILIAGGLVAHGVHEFQEAELLPLLTDEAWNTEFILDDNGEAGKIVRSVFGYNDNPTILEVLAYFGYIGLVLFAWRRVGRK